MYMQTCRKLKRILIAVWMGGASGRDILSGIFSFAKSRNDWQTILLQLPNGFSSEQLQQIGRDGVDGIITCDLSNPRVRKLIDDTCAPLVLIGQSPRSLGNRTNCSCSLIDCDSRAIGTLGARHFLSLGNFNGFGFLLTGRRGMTCPRESGFRNALLAAGRSCSTLMVDTPPDVEIDHKRLSKWILSLPKPAAVMCYFDPQAIQVLNICREQRIDVPRQVAVLGVDNDSLLCESSTPPLSSIQPDHERAGFMAAKELDSLMRHRNRHPRTINCSSMRIDERASTKPCSPAAHLIARALEFIDKQAANGIGVPDVVTHLGVSRRLADLRFREIEGMSIHNAIERRRMAIAEQNLRGSQLSIARVARASGYASIQAFEAAFIRKHGLSPLRFRRAHCIL